MVAITDRETETAKNQKSKITLLWQQLSVTHYKTNNMCSVDTGQNNNSKNLSVINHDTKEELLKNLQAL